MSTRNLKWLAIFLPVVFWIIVLVLRDLLFIEGLTWHGNLFALAMIALGATAFSTWMFRIIENREREIRRRTEQLAALHAAALALTTELDLGKVLQKVVDLSRQLVNARYGALGVLDPSGEQIEQFITSGITPEQRARLGEPPRGHGLLGVPIKEGKPVRVEDIASHPKSAGFPPHHPPMYSLLGVPVKSKGKIFGHLYLTDKISDLDENSNGKGAAFTQHDQEILEMFATQAAIAIENAQLYRQVQQLAVLQERERFGMDLHDGIIQSIYAIGLMLEDGQHRIATEPDEASDRITRAIRDLNEVIRDIRNYILDLRPQRFQGRDLQRGLAELAHDLRANTFINVNLHSEGMNSARLPTEQTVEILHIVQEALNNVRKHARASDVNIYVQQNRDHLQLAVEDNGVGFDPAVADPVHGDGLRNMRERASVLGGELAIEPRQNGGTRVSLRMPLATS